MTRISSFNDSNQTIGNRIRDKREQWGYSQQELAELIDVTLNYLGEIERGRRPLTLPVAEQLCIHFGVTYDYLFLGLNPGTANRLSDVSDAPLNARNALLDIVLAADDDECEQYLQLMRTVRHMVNEAKKAK